MIEKVFPGPAGQQSTPRTGVRALLAGGTTVFRCVTGPGAVARALAEAGRPATAAVTVHDATPVHDHGLDAAFALHLSAHRESVLGLGHRACITALARPALPEGGPLVRIPHLVRAPHDTVVWEVMTELQAHVWLDGAALPDQMFFEDRLNGLMSLRRAHRAGTLAHPGLARALAGAYLSIRFAYLHEEMIRAALQHSDR